MKFSRWLKPLLLMLLLVLGNGCQYLPEIDLAIKSEDEAASELGPVRSANPYLSNRPSISAEASERFQLASTAMASGDWDQAELELLWLTENHPQLSGPYLNLALLYDKSGQVDKVDTAFRQAIASNSNNINAYNQYGYYLRQQGKFSEAEQRYLQALEAWPDSADSHLNLGILYDLYMGKLQMALQHYQSYQSLLDEPERKVKGWIIDTQRRLKKRTQSAGGG